MRLLLSLGCIAAVLGGCAIIVAPNDDIRVRSVFSSDAVQGDGRIVQERRVVGSLAALEVSGPLQVAVRVGGAASLQVEADSNLLPLIRTDASGAVLRIWIDGQVRATGPIRITFTAPQLSDLRFTGSGRVTVDGLHGEPLTVTKSGSGSIALAGRVASLDLQVGGSGNVDARALQSGNANLSLSGSGRIDLGQVRAEALTARLHGSGEIQAGGEVQQLNVRVHGSGQARLSGLSSLRADLATNGSGDIAAVVRESVTARTDGSGRISVNGNPAQRSISGKNVHLLN